jgi:hypothetical protein
VLDHPTPLVEGGARLRLGSLWAFGVGAGFAFPDRVAFESGSVELNLVYGYARACLRVVTTAHNYIETCAEPMLGSLHGEGQGYDSPIPRRLLWASAAGTAALYTKLSEHLHWSAHLRLLAPLIRQGFSVEVENQPVRAFTASPVGGMLSLGIAAEL